MRTHRVPPLAVRAILVRCPRGLFVVDGRGQIRRVLLDYIELVRLGIVWGLHGHCLGQEQLRPLAEHI